MTIHTYVESFEISTTLESHNITDHLCVVRHKMETKVKYETGNSAIASFSPFPAIAVEPDWLYSEIMLTDYFDRVVDGNTCRPATRLAFKESGEFSFVLSTDRDLEDIRRRPECSFYGVDDPYTELVVDKKSTDNIINTTLLESYGIVMNHEGKVFPKACSYLVTSREYDLKPLVEYLMSRDDVEVSHRFSERSSRRLVLEDHHSYEDAIADKTHSRRLCRDIKGVAFVWIPTAESYREAFDAIKEGIHRYHSEVQNTARLLNMFGSEQFRHPKKTRKQKASQIG